MADETGDLSVDYSTDHTSVEGVVAGTWRTEANRAIDANDTTIRIKSVSITKDIARQLNIGIGIEPDERVFVGWTAGLNGATPKASDFLKKGSDWYRIQRVTTRVGGVQFLFLCKLSTSIS